MPESEADYLSQTERLAGDVVAAALDEGWLSFAPDPEGATPLHRAINSLARHRRHHHFEGDGCADPEAPLIGLAGAFVVAPSTAMSAGTYADVCARLGVAARPDGWAVWHGWDERDKPITIVTSKVDTTTGLLLAWSKGRDVMPVRPGVVTATLSGWYGPAVQAPGFAARAGIQQAGPRDTSPAQRDEVGGSSLRD